MRDSYSAAELVYNIGKCIEKKFLTLDANVKIKLNGIYLIRVELIMKCLI